MKPARPVLRALTVLTIVVATAACRNPTPPRKIFVPAGFTGWTSVCFHVPGEPKLPVVDGHLVLQLSESGRLRTSTRVEETLTLEDHFYYGAGEQWKRLDPMRDEEGQLIWGLSGNVRRNLETGKVVSVSSGFFVGAREVWSRLPYDGMAPPGLWDHCFREESDPVRASVGTRWR